MPYNYALMKKQAMREQDAKAQVSTHKTTGVMPGGGFCHEPDVKPKLTQLVISTQYSHTSAARRRRRTKLSKAMAVYAAGTSN